MLPCTCSSNSATEAAKQALSAGIYCGSSLQEFPSLVDMAAEFNDLFADDL